MDWGDVLWDMYEDLESNFVMYLEPLIHLYYWNNVKISVCARTMAEVRDEVILLLYIWNLEQTPTWLKALEQYFTITINLFTNRGCQVALEVEWVPHIMRLNVLVVSYCCLLS